MIHIGIDPGVTGAIALIDDDGLLLEIHDMPVVKVFNQTEILVVALRDTMARFAGGNCQVVIERQNPQPSQGVSSAFRMGKNYGQILSILDLLSMSWSLANPATWKKAMGVSKDKESSLVLAKRIWPQAPLERKKDHNRAEALLLAEWLRRQGISR